MEPKQVIAVRKDLKMRKGKLAAQVAHASMAVVLDMMSKKVMFDRLEDWRLLMSRDSAIYKWLNGPFVKIVVGVESEEELLGLSNSAEKASVPYSLIKDHGRTEFHGVPTFTAIAVGPDKPEKIDEITGHLKLL